MFVDFFGVCMDQIYNHLAKNTYMSDGNVRLPVVITTAIGGGYSDAAQHSQCLYGTFAHMPGLKVVVPSNAYDAKGLMIEAIRDDNPVMFFFHKGIMGLPWMSYFEGSSNAVPDEEYTVPFGEAAVVRRGDDVTIVTLSQMVQKALVAAEAAGARTGISVEVLDLRTLVPLDREAVAASVAKTGRLLIADEDYRSFGLTGEICAIVAERLDTLNMKAPVRRLAVPDVPIPYSRPLERHVIPQVDHIASAARDLVKVVIDITAACGHLRGCRRGRGGTARGVARRRERPRGRRSAGGRRGRGQDLVPGAGAVRGHDRRDRRAEGRHVRSRRGPGQDRALTAHLGVSV